MINEFLDLLLGTNVAERRECQWQLANGLLTDAQTHMSDGNTDKAIAAALIGLLAERLSQR